MYDLDFVWNATSYHNDILQLQVNFTNADKISPSLKQDSLQINLTDVAFLFVSKSRNYLSEDYFILESRIPPQLQNSEFN